jgi:hypothetical protein
VGQQLALGQVENRHMEAVGAVAGMTQPGSLEVFVGTPVLQQPGNSKSVFEETPARVLDVEGSSLT